MLESSEMAMAAAFLRSVNFLKALFIGLERGWSCWSWKRPGSSWSRRWSLSEEHVVASWSNLFKWAMLTIFNLFFILSLALVSLISKIYVRPYPIRGQFCVFSNGCSVTDPNLVTDLKFVARWLIVIILFVFLTLSCCSLLNQFASLLQHLEAFSCDGFSIMITFNVWSWQGWQLGLDSKQKLERSSSNGWLIACVVS